MKETYGDEEAIATTWLDKILKWPKLKGLKDVRTFANDLKTGRETLQAMSFIGYIYVLALIFKSC